MPFLPGQPTLPAPDAEQNPLADATAAMRGQPPARVPLSGYPDGRKHLQSADAAFAAVPRAPPPNPGPRRRDAFPVVSRNKYKASPPFPHFALRRKRCPLRQVVGNGTLLAACRGAP